MNEERKEEERLRAVALQNAKSIFLARQRAEEELARTREALRKQSEWLRVTLASIGDAVVTTDIDGKVLFLNGVAETLTGWTLQQAQGRPLDEVVRIIDEDSRQPVENPARRALEEGRSVGLDFHAILVARDGTETPIDDSAAPIRDDNGATHGVVLIFRSIAARKHTEETQARLAAIVESSQDAIISKTLNSEILSWNAGAEHLFGYTAQEAIGRLITMLIPPDRQDEERVILERLRRGERVEHFETVRVRKDGSRVDISLTTSPIRDGSGRIIGASKIARDITARRQIEAALKESDRRKDEFLAMLAHELRNPLAPIRNAVHLLRSKGPPNPELQWAREVIDRQVSQMTRLVDDLLDVSRITRGRIELRRERVELAALVSSAVEASRPLIEKWGHELTVTLPPEPIHLEADPTRLAQVLLNLLNNAAKYTDQGGRIWLSAGRQGDEVLVRVEDNGIGIPPGVLPRIFDMFTQVDRSSERSEGGLGIGLTLVKQLVELHGGRVEARSEGPGMGSTFVVHLPIRMQLGGDRPREITRDEVVAPPAVACRILVVDDNRDAADSLGLLLRMIGNEVQTAHDGLAAVAAAAAFKPDVVLLDIGLPKLDGYAAARRIREQDGRNDMLLVALTGWGKEEDRRRSKEAGFDHHLTKPVEFEALQKLLADKERTPR